MNANIKRIKKFYKIMYDLKGQTMGPNSYNEEHQLV